MVLENKKLENRIKQNLERGFAKKKTVERPLYKYRNFSTVFFIENLKGGAPLRQGFEGHGRRRESGCVAINNISLANVHP